MKTALSRQENKRPTCECKSRKQSRRAKSKNRSDEKAAACKEVGIVFGQVQNGKRGRDKSTALPSQPGMNFEVWRHGKEDVELKSVNHEGDVSPVVKNLRTYDARQGFLVCSCAQIVQL